MYTFNEDTLVDMIEDEEFINKLIKELDKSLTESTANLGFELPDYTLLFKNDEDMEVFKIGYYKEVQNLKGEGVEGRYWNQNEDLIYKVDLELPID